MKLKPKHNNLVVRPFQLGEVSRSGLLIPEVAKASAPYRYASVVSIGPGRYNGVGQLIPVDNQIGDVVAYARNQGVEFPFDDEDGNEEVLLLINESFLLGTIEDMPVQSSITGIDGRLLRMQPVSRAPSDGTVEHWDRIERATKQGFIDSSGNTLEAMAAADKADAEMES